MKELMDCVGGILPKGLTAQCQGSQWLKMIAGVESFKKILSHVTSNFFKKSG